MKKPVSQSNENGHEGEAVVTQELLKNFERTKQQQFEIEDRLKEMIKAGVLIEPGPLTALVEAGAAGELRIQNTRKRNRSTKILAAAAKT